MHVPRPHVLCGLVLAMALVAPAARGAETVDDILRRLHALEDGPRKWTDRTQKVTLRILDRNGSERQREFVSYNKRYPDGEQKALLFFSAPAEIRGTGFLQFGHRDREDEQWLYLPELKSMRQIAARSKKEKFAGTDFSYQDLEILNEIMRWTAAEAPATLGGEATVGGASAHVIEFRPRDRAAIGYEAVRVWLRKDDLTMAAVELHDARGPVKRLALEEYRAVGAIPTPRRMEMETLKSGGKTVVEVNEVTYDGGLGDDLFTQGVLERGLR